eukprot:12739703-Ditylum_brightwellii.AAC.1
MSNRNRVHSNEKDDNNGEDDSIAVPLLASQDSISSSSSSFTQRGCRKRFHGKGFDIKQTEKERGDSHHGKQSKKRNVLSSKDSIRNTKESGVIDGKGLSTKLYHVNKGGKSINQNSIIQNAEVSKKKSDSLKFTRLPEDFLPSRGKIK